MSDDEDFVCGFICPPPAPEEFPRDGIIAVGFGAAHVLRDGEVVIDGEEVAAFAGSEAEFVRGADAEKRAAADPEHKWEIHLMGPLAERRYVRQPDGRWLLTEKGPGFA